MKIKSKITFVLAALAFPVMTFASTPKEGLQQIAFDSGFYLGGALEFEHMGGRRSDGLTTSLTTGFYSSDAGLSDDMPGFEFFGGLLYRFNNSNFVLGLEPYFGYKANKNTLEAPLAGVQQSAELKREWDLGVLARFGYIVNEQTLVYAVAGPDWGYFKYTQEEIGTPSTTVSSSKWISGVRYGAGVERQFSCFRVGLQATMTNYNNSTLSAPDTSGDVLFVNAKPNVFTLSFRVSYPF